ncbi:unnamed protein product [Adineta steineri]|uniref:Uncharacterized protein n=1 Tax=Adineta steineri TaxID=433720 RepID=A0A814YZR3_9BILA|nr:unnamed protein product [Adineta steineri]CAF3722638.1 unnamed protein product [Adineta steineri]
MSNSLAKKFDKIVSKLSNKHKDTKSNANETNDDHQNVDETLTDGNNEPQHESILQRVKGHLTHTHGSVKNEQHQQQQQTEGAPPIQVIIDNLKDSPFKVLLTHAPMGGGPSSTSGSSTSGVIPSECYKQAREEFDSRYASPATFQLAYKDFQISRPLGRGAFGSVKEVKCIRDPLPDYLQITNPNDSTIKSYRVALKIINKKSAHKMKQEEHVVNEKRILQALNFPFIIRFYFSFKDNANLYIGLELIEGGELFRHLRDCERFDEKKAKFYSSQIILALEYLHLLGIVYRDLKPENLLIDRYGYIKMCDFGFAKKIDRGKAYTLCGTPEFLAPEIILGRGYNMGVDYWALGVLIFEMNAGYSPFWDADQQKIYHKIISAKFRPRSFFTDSLIEIIKGLLQKDLTKRLGLMFNGINDIKKHAWFRDIDWLHIFLKKVRAPWVPDIRTNNFPDAEDEEPARSSVNLYEKEFHEF